MITQSIGTKIESTPRRNADNKPDRMHGNIELQWTLRPNTDAFKKGP
jgi:hypothetical protein